MSPLKKRSSGYLVVLALVFGAIFLTIIVAFLGFVVLENRNQQQKVYKESALEIAEAGLDYYKWHLAHFPSDLTDGTATTGPYIHDYSDPEGGDIGQFSLGITGNMQCNEIASIDIYATGTVNAAPSAARTIYARYARPTVSEFAYIINSNVWAGADRTIVGPYHSNGGVRMDGTNNSSVSSGLEDWLCTSSFGCSPDSTEDGVFGAGPNSVFWSWPSPPINFTGLSVDLSLMKAKATSTGRYFAPSGVYGYHIVFKSNGTFDLYRVTNTDNFEGYTTENGWQYERHVITAEVFVANYTIPSSCAVIFVEDKLWIDGTVNAKVTVAAANVTTAGVNPDLILEGNLTYGTSSNTGLLAIGENNVLIPLDSPDNMTVKGIFVAQTGRFGRNHYTSSGSHDVPSAYDSYVIQSSLTVQGTIVSNGREGTKWTSGGVQTSGYTTRSNSYDRALVSSPPPLTPHTSDTYKFIEWRELH